MTCDIAGGGGRQGSGPLGILTMLRSLVRVLQRNVTSRKKYIQFYYKELAHVSMEAKSRCMECLQAASWRPRKADGTNASPKAGRLKTQEELIFLAESEVWEKIKKTISQLTQSGRRRFLSFLYLFVLVRSSVDLLSLTYLGRAICFIEFTNSNINLIQKLPHRHSQNSVWAKVWASCGPIKLTQIEHHSPYLSINVNVFQQVM